MKIKMKAHYGALAPGDVVDAAVALNGNAYVFDKSNSAYFIYPSEFEILPEERTSGSAQASLVNVTQKMKSLQIEFQ